MSHEEEMKKLMANHDELEARVRCLQGNEHSAHTINECTQSQSHPHQTNNTLDDNNISHEHRQTQDGRILCQISKDSSNPRSVPGELKDKVVEVVGEMRDSRSGRKRKIEERKKGT